VAHSDTALEFTGVTAIEDSDANAEYGYGYADVTPNGSQSSYGSAENPYTPYSNGKTGGDGFDLDWATDITTGMPVNISNLDIKYVRVYSPILHNAGAFGETSPEVTGVFVTPRVDGRTDVGQTLPPSITIGNTNISIPTTPSYGNVYYVDLAASQFSSGTTIAVTPNNQTTNANIYINNTPDDQALYNGSKYVRVVVQDGSKAPRIIVMKMR
jgi:hypothetical protein